MRPQDPGDRIGNLLRGLGSPISIDAEGGNRNPGRIRDPILERDRIRKGFRNGGDRNLFRDARLAGRIHPVPEDRLHLLVQSVRSVDQILGPKSKRGESLMGGIVESGIKAAFPVSWHGSQFPIFRKDPEQPGCLHDIGFRERMKRHWPEKLAQDPGAAASPGKTVSIGRSLGCSGSGRKCVLNRFAGSEAEDRPGVPGLAQPVRDQGTLGGEVLNMHESDLPIRIGNLIDVAPVAWPHG